MYELGQKGRVGLSQLLTLDITFAKYLFANTTGNREENIISVCFIEENRNLKILF